jgi:hypothetical protein
VPSYAGDRGFDVFRLSGSTRYKTHTKKPTKQKARAIMSTAKRNAAVVSVIVEPRLRGRAKTRKLAREEDR